MGEKLGPPELKRVDEMGRSGPVPGIKRGSKVVIRAASDRCPPNSTGLSRVAQPVEVHSLGSQPGSRRMPASLGVE